LSAAGDSDPSRFVARKSGIDFLLIGDEGESATRLKLVQFADFLLMLTPLGASGLWPGLSAH
jgi:hypothetical protein